jgi:hypothetical protein
VVGLRAARRAQAPATPVSTRRPIELLQESVMRAMKRTW